MDLALWNDRINDKRHALTFCGWQRISAVSSKNSFHVGRKRNDVTYTASQTFEMSLSCKKTHLFTLQERLIMKDRLCVSEKVASNFDLSRSFSYSVEKKHWKQLLVPDIQNISFKRNGFAAFASTFSTNQIFREVFTAFPEFLLLAAYV